MTDLVSDVSSVLFDGSDYPTVWGVLGGTLTELVGLAEANLSSENLAVVSTGIERIVDALESSLATVANQQLRVAEAEANMTRLEVAVASAFLSAVDFCGATKYRWFFMVDGETKFLVPESNVEIALENAKRFLELWPTAGHPGKAECVVTDHSDDAAGIVVDRFELSGLDGGADG